MQRTGRAVGYEGRVTPSGPAPTPIPAPALRRRTARLRRWLHRALQPFWVVPALWCAAAVAAGVLIPELDDSASDWMPFVFQGGAEGARTVLSTIAGAMISVTVLVFSITIVVLQLASSQFSPRVLQTFLTDRVTQNTLGVFTASFLYSLTVLRSVEGGTGLGGGPVPQLGVTVAFLLVLAAVAMFLAFIHHITQSISVSTVIRNVGDETRAPRGAQPGGPRAGAGAGPGATAPGPPDGRDRRAVRLRGHHRRRPALPSGHRAGPARRGGPTLSAAS